MIIRLMLGGVLALAGCSQGPSGPAPQASPTPVASPAGAIPADLQGRYGLTAAACAPSPSRADLNGLLTIGGDAIAFGIAPASVDRVAIRADRVTFDTSDTAEGMVESRRYAFRVSPDRRELTRLEAGRPDRVYTRCANGPN